MLGSKKMAFRTVHEQERLGNGKEWLDSEQEMVGPSALEAGH